MASVGWSWSVRGLVFPLAAPSRTGGSAPGPRASCGRVFARPTDGGARSGRRPWGGPRSGGAPLPGLAPVGWVGSASLLGVGRMVVVGPGSGVSPTRPFPNRGLRPWTPGALAGGCSRASRTVAGGPTAIRGAAAPVRLRRLRGPGRSARPGARAGARAEPLGPGCGAEALGPEVWGGGPGSGGVGRRLRVRGCGAEPLGPGGGRGGAPRNQPSVRPGRSPGRTGPRGTRRRGGGLGIQPAPASGSLPS